MKLVLSEKYYSNKMETCCLHKYLNPSNYLTEPPAANDSLKNFWLRLCQPYTVAGDCFTSSTVFYVEIISFLDILQTLEGLSRSIRVKCLDHGYHSKTPPGSQPCDLWYTRPVPIKMIMKITLMAHMPISSRMWFFCTCINLQLPEHSDWTLAVTIYCISIFISLHWYLYTCALFQFINLCNLLCS